MTRFLCARDHALSDELVCADSQLSSPYAQTSSAIPLNQWSLVTVTRTSAGVFNLYINGALNGSANQSGGATSSDGASFIIGGDTASYYFAGSIDDARTYGRVLSASEIMQIYEAGASTCPSSGLVGWWKLDDASSGNTLTSAADSSGNGNTGTTGGSSTDMDQQRQDRRRADVCAGQQPDGQYRHAERDIDRPWRAVHSVFLGEAVGYDRGRDLFPRQLRGLRDELFSEQYRLRSRWK